MFNNNVKEDLLKLKEELQTKYISIFNNGKIREDKSKEVFDWKEQKINDNGSVLDSFIKNTIEKICNDNINFDRVDYLFELGLLFPKNTLGENNEILPTSKALDNKVRFYTGNVKVYNNGQQVKELTGGMTFLGYQGYLNYNDFVNSIKKENLVLIGPQSFNEFKELILSKEQQDIILSIDLSNKKENNNVVNLNKEEKVKRLSLFRK